MLSRKKLASFLYRRLAKVVTCEFRLDDAASLRMRSKYDVASFADVFIHPFYWQLYHLMRESPRLIVDCGAHCGHFSILADRCVHARFPDAHPRFMLIEPNPQLLPIIRDNLGDAGILDRAAIGQFLLGSTEGTGSLWVNPKNFLVSRLQQFDGATRHDVPYKSLESLLDGQAIDALKIDIEGAEFELVRTQSKVFERVKLLLIEAHGSPSEREEMVKKLKETGLNPAQTPIDHGSFQLLAFARDH